MAPLDSSIVNTVLPIIAREFRADVLLIEWVVLAYLLSLSSLLLIGGRLGDLFGNKPLYIAGFALFALSSMLALSRGAAWGWTSHVVLLGGAIGATTAILFLRTELRSPHPFFDIRLFRHRLFAAATVSAMLNYMATSTTAFLTPFFLIQGNHMAPARAGSLLMAMPLVMATVAPMSGWLSDRIGSRIPTVTGMACLATGMFLLGRLEVGGSDHQIVLRLALVGLGIGLFTSPNNSAIMGAVPQTHQGLGSGIVATARTMGNVLGVAVSGSLFGTEVQKLVAVLGQESLAVAGAYRHAVTIGAGIAFAGAITSLIRGNPMGRGNFKLKTDN
jgi:MFS family permease